MPKSPDANRRQPLNRERVLHAAVELADEAGLDGVSMRRLGDALGVEAMSLYNHVPGKEDLLDAMVDAVIGEIEEAVRAGVPEGPDWRSRIREQALCARGVVLRHPWAPRLIGSRSEPSPRLVRYLDRVIGTLREAGFSMELVHHALHVLGSRLLGFTQELFQDDDPDPQATERFLLRHPAASIPNIHAMLGEVRHDDEEEFVFGLDLILDGLERLRS